MQRIIKIVQKNNQLSKILTNHINLVSEETIKPELLEQVVEITINLLESNNPLKDSEIQNKKIKVIAFDDSRRLSDDHEDNSNYTPNIYENVWNAVAKIEGFEDLKATKFASNILNCLNKESEKYQLTNPNNEISYMVDYINTKWEGADYATIDKICRLAWGKSIIVTKDMIDELHFSNMICDWLEERNDFKNWKNHSLVKTEDELKSVMRYDDIHNVIFNILMGSNNIRSASFKNWDFDDQSAKMIKLIESKFPQSHALRPKGWNELENNSYDDGPHYTQSQRKIDNAIFNGVDSSTHGGYGFTKNISLEDTMYNENDQNRNPLTTLVGAILSHAIFLNMKNNSFSIIQELEILRKASEKPEYIGTIVYKFVEADNIENKFVKTMLSSRSRDNNALSEVEHTKEIMSSLTSRRNFEALSVEKKAKRKKETTVVVAEIFNEVFSESELDTLRDIAEIDGADNIKKPENQKTKRKLK